MAGVASLEPSSTAMTSKRSASEGRVSSASRTRASRLASSLCAGKKYERRATRGAVDPGSVIRRIVRAGPPPSLRGRRRGGGWGQTKTPAGRSGRGRFEVRKPAWRVRCRRSAGAERVWGQGGRRAVREGPGDEGRGDRPDGGGARIRGGQGSVALGVVARDVATTRDEFASRARDRGRHGRAEDV